MESQKNAERFFENYLNGVYENLNLEIDEEVFFLTNFISNK